MNRSWLGLILARISDDPASFYTKFLPNSRLDNIGMSIRIQPCPICGHYDCCTVTPGNIGVNCFHTNCFAGNHVKFILESSAIEQNRLIADIAEFYSIPYPGEENEKERKFYEIREHAVKFYHTKLMANEKALTYQLQTRRHSPDTLRAFNVGFSESYPQLKSFLITTGYTEEEIKEAKVWMPDGVFVYPYLDPFTKRVLRFNTKNPFNALDFDGKVIVGYSVGQKCMMTSPKLSYEYIVLVEGENDLMSTYAAGSTSLMAVGGKLSPDQKEMFKKVLPKFNKIYCAFDNDDAGREYEAIINELFPNLYVYHLDYGNSKDPDEAFANNRVPGPFSDLLAKAKLLETTGYAVSHKGKTWTSASRTERLEFEITGKTTQGIITGTAKYIKDDAVKDIAYDAQLSKSKYKPLNFYLIDAMDEYFNEGLDEMSLEELCGVYHYTKWKAQVIKIAASIIFKVDDSERERMVVVVKKFLGEEVTDIILKEVNELQNEEITDFAAIPRMKLGQFFSVKNKEAFMYFTYVKRDGDTIRKLPYLLTSDKQLIRLDLYKRKDPQCLILIRNKYEMPSEVPTAIMDLQRISLSQVHVEDFIEDRIDKSELEPKLLIRRIENFIRRYYFTDDDKIFKILALWIYGTYCYELFGQYPYLFLNGPKGSGKTIIDTCIDLLAFNPKMTVSITDAALFRSISFEGGTLILDEMEALSNRKKTEESDLAAVLKGGYMRSGCAMRCDKDNGNMPQMFDVFGPKVISNINGLEDIIGDRCIPVSTSYKPTFAQLSKLEDPKQVYIDGLSAVRELTSKCALSILTHFDDIYTVFKGKVFNAGNARLSQILRPLQTLAHFAGKDYEAAFADFYSNNVKVIKEETEYETPEGALKDILKEICLEILGRYGTDVNYISTNVHKYKGEIKHNISEGWFEIDTMHIKTFMEETIGGFVDQKNINTWMRRVCADDVHNHKRRTTVSLETDGLQREYNGNSRLKVSVFKLKFSDFLPVEEIAEAIISQAEAGLDFPDL